jgi:hypothetical protein
MTISQPRNDISWLLEDALFLHRSGKKYGAILLLVCAVDALARQVDPTNTNNADRFEKFLRSKMRRADRPQIHNIHVPKLNRLFSFEYIIYKFLRCPLVHEGSWLEASDPDEFPVCLDWDTIPHGVKVDSENNRVILGGELVMNLLADAVHHELQSRGIIK